MTTDDILKTAKQVHLLYITYIHKLDKIAVFILSELSQKQLIDSYATDLNQVIFSRGKN